MPHGLEADDPGGSSNNSGGRPVSQRPPACLTEANSTHLADSILGLGLARTSGRETVSSPGHATELRLLTCSPGTGREPRRARRAQAVIRAHEETEPEGSQTEAGGPASLAVRIEEEATECSQLRSQKRPGNGLAQSIQKERSSPHGPSATSESHVRL